MSDAKLQERVEAVRRFSRFYTRKIGVLGEGLLGSPYSLAEARVIWELGHRGRTTARELARELGVPEFRPAAPADDRHCHRC